MSIVQSETMREDKEKTKETRNLEMSLGERTRVRARGRFSENIGDGIRRYRAKRFS